MILRRPSAPPAFSIVECAISTIIVGVALVAAVSAVGSARQGEVRLTASRQALVLAEDLMVEIAAQPYADSSDTASSFGPTSAESAAGNRSLFNDVNDYRAWTENPPFAKTGATLQLDSTWTRAVAVTFLNPAAPASTSATDQGLAQITITVRKSGDLLATLAFLRSAGLPATQSCQLPAAACMNLAPVHCTSQGGTAGGPGTSCWTTPETASRVGLVALWPMNESSGTTIADTVGTSNGTLLNGPTFSAGKFGNALTLDGVNDYASVPNNANLSQNNTFTLAAWMYFEVVPVLNKWQVAIYKGATTSTPLDYNYALACTNGKVDFEFIDNATGVNQVFTGGSITTIRTWYHLAATYDHPNNTVKLYLNGALVATTSTTKIPKLDTKSLWIGADPFGIDNTKGRIDDARIYSRVLSDAEITTLYSGGEP